MSGELKHFLDDLPNYLTYRNAWRGVQVCDVMLQVSYFFNRKRRQAVICSWLSRTYLLRAIGDPVSLANFMELSPSWEAASCSATQELRNILRNQGFIAVFTRAIHLFLTWARSIQSIQPHPISIRYILILSTHLRLGLRSGLFPPGFHTNILYAFNFSPFVLHALHISTSLTWSF
jgi:hypothetical protein